MGSIVKFNYNRPGVEPGTRFVLMMTPYWMGNLHGLKSAGLDEAEKYYIMNVFAAMYNGSEDLVGDAMATKSRILGAIDKLSGELADLKKRSESVVMRPMNQGIGGMAQQAYGAAQQAYSEGQGALGAAKAAGKSIFGVVSTFGRSQIQPEPQNQNPALQNEIQIKAAAIETEQQKFERLMNYMSEMKTRDALTGKTPRDPYEIYYRVVKPMFPPGTLKNIYRKYDRRFISGERVVETPPGVTFAT